MAIAVLAEYSNEDPNTSTAGTSIQVSGVVVPAGATIQVWACEGDVQPITITDNVNPGSYAAGNEGLITDVNSGNSVEQFHFQNSAAGTLTITATYGANVAQKGIWVAIITGARAASFDQSTGQAQSSLPSSLTSGPTGTLTAQPALVIGLCSCTQDNLIATADTGSGFTSTKTAWSGPQLPAVSEYKRVTVTTPQAATFITGGGIGYISTVAIFLEASGSPTASVAWLRA
jgi:hypothetical protein